MPATTATGREVMTAGARISVLESQWTGTATSPTLVLPRSVNGTITQLQLSRGAGTLLGEDGKRYTFRRSDVREVWFHDLTDGARVAFEPAKNLSATQVRPVVSSV
jgi:hypothetical protein